MRLMQSHGSPQSHVLAHFGRVLGMPIYQHLSTADGRSSHDAVASVELMIYRRGWWRWSDDVSGAKSGEARAGLVGKQMLSSHL